MAEKRQKFEADLDRLIGHGERLMYAIQNESNAEEFRKELKKHLTAERVDKFLSNLPNFKDEYQQWYSEAHALVRQVLPDRIQDFASHYEFSRTRKSLHYENYRIKDYLKGLRREGIVSPSAAIPEFHQQLNIVRAAKSTLDSRLIDLRRILQADLFDSELDGARYLAKAGYLRAAGVICGVVIETHLGQVCKDRGVRIRKQRPTINDYAEVLKEKGVVDIPRWRRLQGLADTRNLCGHKRERDPTEDELQDLISGTDQTIKSVF